MEILRIRGRNRVGCSHLFVAILLSFAITLSLSLVTPVIAQDECEGSGLETTGWGVWYFPGYDLGPPIGPVPPASGRSVWYYKECKNENPARGYLFTSFFESDEWILVTANVEGAATKVVYGEWWTIDTEGFDVWIEGDASWLVGKIINSNNPALIGTWLVAAALDGGGPGRSGDVLFLLKGAPSYQDALNLYNLGISGTQIYPFWANLTSGKVIIR